MSLSRQRSRIDVHIAAMVRRAQRCGSGSNGSGAFTRGRLTRMAHPGDRSDERAARPISMSLLTSGETEPQQLCRRLRLTSLSFQFDEILPAPEILVPRATVRRLH